MEIRFRTSGGRGEYELSGRHLPYLASTLEGWSFRVGTPDGNEFDLNLVAKSGESKKPRLRSTRRQPFQIGRSIASLLLLPDPGRDKRHIGALPQIFEPKSYLVSAVVFSPETSFDPNRKSVLIRPSIISVGNAKYSDDLSFDRRWNRILAILSEIDRLPSNLAGPLGQYRRSVENGISPSSELVRVVQEIATELFEIGDSPVIDPLHGLETLLEISPADTPHLPPPDKIPGDVPEIARRAAHEYRLAKQRDAGSAKFRRQVLKAYDFKCAICGSRFGNIEGVPSGIDAAHILAWTNYNLDVVQNGMALCKLHHWAFDGGLIMPTKINGEYYFQKTKISLDLDMKTWNSLHVPDGPLRFENLPEDPSLHPSEIYLNQLHSDMNFNLSESSE
ncbi:HNH endonuclease [Kocuria palustris]|uniref:HNH endonuclease n=1 Tax=Kocuria palustris TaxID=71999 RepID=UPI003658085D